MKRSLKSKRNYGNLVNLCLAALLLFATLGCGFIDGFKKGYSDSRGGGTSNSPITSSSPQPVTKVGDSSIVPEPVLFSSRNGFNTSGPYDKTFDYYPGAAKTKAAIYSKGSGEAAKVIHGEAATYGSSGDASDGFDKHLKMLTDKGATINERGTVKDSTYSYYHMNRAYGFCVVSGVSVVDYSGWSMEDLQNFLK